LLLERHARVVVTHFAGHGFGENRLERPHHLRRTVAGRRRRVDLRAAVEVVAHREFRAGDVADRRQRRQRHRFALVVAHVELPDVLDVGAVVAFGLDVDLPLASEAVEVVDEAAAEEALQRLVHITEVDPLLEHLVLVDVDEQLRHGRPEGRRDAGHFGSLLRGFEKLGGVLGEEGDVFSGAVLSMKVAPPETPTPDCRWRKGKGDGAGDAAEFFVSSALIAVYCSSGFLRAAQSSRLMKKKAL
jgi:hypothetical protein